MACRSTDYELEREISDYGGLLENRIGEIVNDL